MQEKTETINRYKDISLFPFSLPYVSGPEEIPNEEYHNGEKYSAFVSSSGLKLYKTSPLWFKFCTTEEQKEIGKDAEIVGSAYHDWMASLANAGDESMFRDKWFEFSGPVNPRTNEPYGLSTKAYAEAEQEAMLLNEGKRPLSAETIKQIKAMTNHLLYGNRENSADIRTLLKWGKAEKSYFCEYEGAYFKFRTDLSTGKKIVDWKTSNEDDLHEETIRRIIFKYGYDISAAFYQFMNKIITGKWKEFYWVFQQKKPPYDFVIVDSQPFTYFFENEVINGKREKIVTNTNVGARKMHALLDQHIHCVEENYWPGAAIFIPQVDFGLTRGKRIMGCDIPVYAQKDLIFYND